MRTWLIRGGVAIVMFLGLLVAVLYSRYGGGEAFPPRRSAAMLPEDALELVAELPEPPGNIAVSRDNRIFLTIHPESKPPTNRVVEIVNGQMRPFPDEAAQSELYHAPQGIRIDRQGRLWTIDHGDNGIQPARLVAVDLASGAAVHDFTFPREIAPLFSYLQDLAISSDGRHVFIADVSFFRKSPALVVYDVERRIAWRVLEKHPALLPENYFIQAYNGPMIRLGGLLTMKVGVDSIALDQRGEWLYFGAMNHREMYRLPARALIESEKDPGALETALERFGDKVQSDGITVDEAGNIYITDMENRGVAVLGQDRKLRTYLHSDRLRWPDGFSFGGDGFVYLADSAIPDIVLQSRGQIEKRAPYQIFRFRPLASGAAGQ